MYMFIYLRNVLSYIYIYTSTYPLEAICSVYVVPWNKIALIINTAD